MDPGIVSLDTMMLSSGRISRSEEATLEFTGEAACGPHAADPFDWRWNPRDMKAREPTTQRVYFSVYRNKNWHRDQKGRKNRKGHEPKSSV